MAGSRRYRAAGISVFGESLCQPLIAANSGSQPLLILPAVLARSPEIEPWLARLQPRLLVIYGGAVRPGDYQRLAKIPCRLTMDGAVSVFLEPDAVRVRQWGY